MEKEADATDTRRPGSGQGLRHRVQGRNQRGIQRHDCQVNVVETYWDGLLVGRQLEVTPEP